MIKLNDWYWIAGGIILFQALFPDLNLAVVVMGSVNSYQVDLVAEGRVGSWIHEI